MRKIRESSYRRIFSWMYLNQTDPDGALSWLVQELLRAEKDQNYVYILGHIPPGNADCLESWTRNYYKIINRLNFYIVDFHKDFH